MFGSPSILVVDDCADDVFLTGRLLRLAGFAPPFQSADSCEAAMHLLTGDHAGAFQLVFLDMHLPAIDGFEMLHWIRAQPELSALRILMLSTSNRPEDIARARELGADAYLVKHPAPSHLRAILSEIDPGLCPAQTQDAIDLARRH